MLPFKSKRQEDYKQRSELLRHHGALEWPDRKMGKPFRILDRTLVNELSFLLFTGWLFTGIFNAKKQTVRASLVPADDKNRVALLVLWRHGTRLAPPGRSGTVGTIVDDDYFQCPLDRAGGATLDANTRLLCPVLNRIRYNLGHSDLNTATLKAPKKSQECCDSGKKALWTYLADTVVSEPERYGAAMGGAALPIHIGFDLLATYLRGTEPTADELGMLFEETLLWYACDAAEATMGQPHVTFTQPFISNEIDFFVYDTAGHDREAKDGSWTEYIAEQSICIFELTLGHNADEIGNDGGDRAQPEEEGRRVAGQDHPKNKIINHLALTSVGFRDVSYCYLSATGAKNMAPATERALRNISRFDYWSLTDEVSDLPAQVAGHFDTRIPATTLRAWHRLLVDKVVSAAKAFAVRRRDDAAGTAQCVTGLK